MAAQAGWEIPLPARLPAGYHYQSAYYDAAHQMVVLTYLVTRPLPGAADASLTASKTITLAQARRNDAPPMLPGPGAQVSTLQVNGQPAAYAVGAWDAQFVPDASDPNGGKMVTTWRNDLAVKNLDWQVGKLYLALITDDEAVSQSALIEMAASLGGK